MSPPQPPRSGIVLVTGATGFIGSRLVQALVARGDRVRALVRDRANAGQLGGAELFIGDLLDPSSLAGIESGVNRVIHAASLLGKWGTDPELLRALNVDAAVALLERCAGSGIERYVHLSAGGVTGPLSGTTADETSPCRPATDYERTKYEGERRVLARAVERGLPVVVVRPTFTYGPGDPHKLPLFRAVLRGRYVFIGGGRSVNHPAYIDDVVTGILLALDRGASRELYIIGGAAPATKRELVRAIATALGVSVPRLSIPTWIARLAAPPFETLGRTCGFEPMLTRSRVMMMADNFGYSIAKARRELAYEPRMPLEEGIARTVAAYRAAGLL